MKPIINRHRHHFASAALAATLFGQAVASCAFGQRVYYLNDETLDADALAAILFDTDQDHSETQQELKSLLATRGIEIFNEYSASDATPRSNSVHPSPSSDTPNATARVAVDFEFALNSYELPPSSLKQLNQVALALTHRRSRDKVLLIVGHTDKRGNADSNLVLSRQRAAAVRDYLVFRGVAPSRLETHGAGETQNLPGTTGWESKNRRVEFTQSG